MRNLSKHLLLASAGAVVCLLLIHKIASHDVWFHLKAGEWLLSGGGFPEQDPFSFTSNERWINLNWAFQVPLALAHRLGGLGAITIMNALIIAAAMALIAREGMRSGVAPETAVVLIALAALASSHRLLVRPESVSLLFLAVALILAEAALAGRTRLLWGFPLIQVLWVNTEALFPIGLGVLGAAGIEAAWRSATRHSEGRRDKAGPGKGDGWSSRRRDQRADQRAGRKADKEADQKGVGKRARKARPNGLAAAGGEILHTWLPVGVVSVVACFLNPYGLQGVLLPLRFLRIMGDATNVAGQPVLELRSPFDPLVPVATMLPFFVCAAVILAVVCFRVRRLGPFRLILFVVFGYLALTSVRNIPLFALVGSFVAMKMLARVPMPGPGPRQAGAGVQRTGTRMRSGHEGVWLTWVRLGLAGLFIFIAAGTASSGLYHALGLRRQFGLGLNPGMFPAETVECLASSSPARIMNDHALGHFLIWRLWPQTRVFLDGRSEVYDERQLRRLQACSIRVDLFDRFAEQAGIATALIGHRPAYLWPLLAGLAAHPQWEIAAHDDAAVLFTRRVDVAAIDTAAESEAQTAPAPAPAARTTPAPVPPAADAPPPEFPLWKATDMPKARKRSFLACWFDPSGRDQAEAHMARALMFLQVNDPEQAAAQALAAARAAPWIPDAYNHLGAALIRAGRLADARIALLECLSIAPDYTEAVMNLRGVELALQKEMKAPASLGKGKAAESNEAAGSGVDSAGSPAQP